jgi:tetratricopeptide (TPR) repeat protein
MTTPPPSAGVSASRNGAWRFGVIAAATLAVYWPACRGGWLWDDGLEIVENPLLRADTGWWKCWTAPAGLDYLPLKTSLQWLEWHAWGAWPLGYHAVNVFLHLLGACLLWRVLAQLGVKAAWWGGLLFAVHPAAVESVAWISEFKNVLALPPLLLAFSAYLEFEASDRSGRRALMAGAAWFAAALLCKGSAVMFPVCLLVYAWWRRGTLTRADVAGAMPFFLLSLVCGLVTVEFQWHRAMATVAVGGEWGAHIAQSGWTLLAYLCTAFFPVHLAPVYGPIERDWPWLPWVLFAMGFAVCWSRRNGWGRHAGFAGAWFVLNLVPVLGFIPMAYLRVSPRADHLAYLALAGWAGGMAAALGALYSRGASQGWSAAWKWAAAVCIAAFAWDARSYAGKFRSEDALWTYAAARQPDAWVARANFGKVLLGRGQFGPAEAEFAAAAGHQPQAAEVRANWGDALERLNRPADALAQYQESVRLDPRFAGGHYNLGRAWLQRGEISHAVSELRAAVALDPDYAAAHNNLGLALARAGDRSAAEAEFRAALKIAPVFPEAHLNLGNIYFRNSRPAEALAEYRAALRDDPGYLPARHNLEAVEAFQAQSPSPR